MVSNATWRKEAFPSVLLSKDRMVIPKAVAVSRFQRSISSMTRKDLRNTIITPHCTFLVMEITGHALSLPLMVVKKTLKGPIEPGFKVRCVVKNFQRTN